MLGLNVTWVVPKKHIIKFFGLREIDFIIIHIQKDNVNVSLFLSTDCGTLLSVVKYNIFLRPLQYDIIFAEFNLNHKITVQSSKCNFYIS